MSNLAEARAIERQLRDGLRETIEAMIAIFAPGQEDKVREAFQPALDRLDAAEARDDAVAAEVLADVSLTNDGRK